MHAYFLEDQTLVINAYLFVVVHVGRVSLPHVLVAIECHCCRVAAEEVVDYSGLRLAQLLRHTQRLVLLRKCAVTIARIKVYGLEDRI